MLLTGQTFTSHFDIACFGRLDLGFQLFNQENKNQLDGSLPANPVNDRRVVYNAVTLKSTFCQP